MIVIFWLLMGTSAFAVGVDEKRLSDPAEEARAQEIMKQLRCLVCQNQSIVDSDAGLAKDIRIIVRERILAGDTDQQVLTFMTERYGDWVLLKPPFDGATIILWLSPLLLLGVGFIIIIRNQRNRKMATSAPLSDEEQKRIAQLLNENGDN
ncbi:cytochrome c-type biogenesis protein CcmH [Emcibacteraceae bacterium]|uniref:cytochrome c-type biogenesis protein n=1 Tax=Pseudemcibacter sp. TaxID=2943293 RepID=UPI0023189F91|nr:cytochrome c-type biogenesis protein CcmH [Emcibacteraceae bacterium]MDA9179988.1 cytochrome c-type biogenesis protein CcmH [Emcibacteraceae bacterium]MDA9553138.1 cytochrome c-type biogenesis protein CcmH [Emcibacteraceae bacterium]MDA9770556.1 cytochrome c-type biogenesis protein CcmH [Emcibacteraceae bacterium]